MKHILSLLLILNITPAFADQQARKIVKDAINYWRDQSSYSVVDMNIHRTSWQRTMTLKVWTKGMKHSLVRVIAPKKDKGNATLTKKNNMWSFSPKINRLIRIPSSMMNQAWMGSDFSNNDVAKADNILKHYKHKIIAISSHQGKKLFTIEAIPHYYAPVVWGKEIVKIRADHIVLEHAFYDQDNQLVKTMKTRNLQYMGGKLIATRQRMQKADKPHEWTEIIVKKARFKLNIPNRMFTLSNLRNPRY
jgi:uncharacterized protein YxeA